MNGSLEPRAYEYRHIVGFEETNLVGNVYYVNHLKWQGRTREMFLREFVPEILDDLSERLSLATLHASCDYLMELRAFDEVIIRMTLGEITQSRISLRFEYWRSGSAGEELIARGRQDIACLRREGNRLAATPVPHALREALRAFGGDNLICSEAVQETGFRSHASREESA